MEAVTTAGFVPRAPRRQLPEYRGREVLQDGLVAPAPYVTVALASAITGFTEKAIRRKIEDGVWVEGAQWARLEDRTIVIIMEGYRKWVEQAPALRRAKAASA